MARTVLAPQTIIRGGLDPVLSAANVDGHSINNDEETYIEVLNGSAAPITVTVLIPTIVDGVGMVNGGKQVTVPAGGRRKIGPFPGPYYNQPDGSVHVNFSAVASVTVGAFRL